MIGACVAKGGTEAPVYPGEPEPGGKQVHNQAPKWEEGCQARQRAGAPRMSERLAEKLGWDPPSTEQDPSQDLREQELWSHLGHKDPILGLPILGSRLLRH